MNAAHQEAMNNPMKLQMWPVEGRTYHDDVDSAMNVWIALGYKYEVENAINTLRAEAGEEGADFLERLRSQAST